MSLRPTLPLLAMGLRHPRNPLPKTHRNPLPGVSYPTYHPLRSQYPHPNVFHLSRSQARSLPTSPPPSHGPPTHFRIQLKRSPLGLPKVYAQNLQKMGLMKKDRIVFHPFSDVMGGRILRVKELVEVRNVSWWQMEDEMKRGKGEASGLERWEDKLRGKRFGEVGEEFAL